MIYDKLLRPLLFHLDAEKAHNLTLGTLKNVLEIPGVKSMLKSRFVVANDDATTSLWGLDFKNPVGLAAGLDKDGIIGRDWAYLGFGFVEVGTVTPKPQQGNPRKRLFRLPQDQAIINRMGFNNRGVDALVDQLKRKSTPEIILGANIGKNKDTPNHQAIEDYLICFRKLRDLVDYFVVNVSSPNTPGLRELQEKAPLTELLFRLQEENHLGSICRPLLLKIAPDLHHTQLDDIMEVAIETKLSGIIATNTTVRRGGLSTEDNVVSSMGQGGLSGKPLSLRSREVLAYLSQHVGTSLSIVSVGGIDSGAEARQRLQMGANLVQLYTGFVYQGPELIREIVGSLLVPLSSS